MFEADAFSVPFVRMVKQLRGCLHQSVRMVGMLPVQRRVPGHG